MTFKYSKSCLFPSSEARRGHPYLLGAAIAQPRPADACAIAVALAAAEAWPLIIILVVASVAGLFYYLRVAILSSARAHHADPDRLSQRRFHPHSLVDLIRTPMEVLN